MPLGMVMKFATKLDFILLILLTVTAVWLIAVAMVIFG